MAGSSPNCSESLFKSSRDQSGRNHQETVPITPLLLLQLIHFIEREKKCAKRPALSLWRMLLCWSPCSSWSTKPNTLLQETEITDKLLVVVVVVGELMASHRAAQILGLVFASDLFGIVLFTFGAFTTCRGKRHEECWLVHESQWDSCLYLSVSLPTEKTVLYEEDLRLK